MLSILGKTTNCDPPDILNLALYDHPSHINMVAFDAIANRLRWQPEINWVDLVTDQPALWIIFVVLLATSSALAGFGISSDNDSELYVYLWQALLHCLASYCAMAPMLRVRRKRPLTARNHVAADVIFYGTVILSFITAIIAPIVYKHGGHKRQSGAILLNFASAALSTAAAGQLAARIESVLDKK